MLPVVVCNAASTAAAGEADPDADCHEGEDDGPADRHGADKDLLLWHILCTCYSRTHSRVRCREGG